MSSGVEVDDSVMSTYKQVINERKYRAAVLRIGADKTKIEVEATFDPSASTGDAKADWAKIVKSLPDNDCRYVISDFTFEHQGTMKQKVLFAAWIPDTASVMKKYLYASSTNSLTRKLEGIQRNVSCSDEEDISYAAISKLLKSGTASY